MALKALLRSRMFVAGLNAAQLLCISIGFGLLLPASEFHVIGKLACAVTAAITILFLSSGKASKTSTAVVIACNCAVLAGTSVLLLCASSTGVAWPLQPFSTAVLLLLLVVSALNVASAASSWSAGAKR